MSVLFETSIGDLVVELFTEKCPVACENFLKLCKVYYYNHCAFFNVQKDFIVQAGDPTDTGQGGESVWHYIDSKASEPKGVSRFFKPERHPHLKHTSLGTISMACSDDGAAGSIFFITLTESATYLDGKHAPFGRIVDDNDTFATLQKFNTEVLTDDNGKPLRDVRIRFVEVLDDPYDDPPGLVVPDEPPQPTAAQLKSLTVGEDEQLPDETTDEAELERIRREREARAQALTLEMIGDLPFADVAPPENVLFVCKLNRVTRSEDLELIFSRFGTILSCEVIRDKRTGDSLNYAFIEFEKQEEAERAYMKMNDVLIDDRRIRVDFSQSVAKYQDFVQHRSGKQLAPDRNAGSFDDGKSVATPRSRGGNKGYGDMVFDVDDYSYKNHSRARKGGDDRRHDDRSRDKPRHSDDRDRRRRSRSRERSPRRSSHRDSDRPRHRDEGRDRDRYR